MMKGSDILKDNKKERFAQDIASGVAPREAYLRLRPDTKKNSRRGFLPHAGSKPRMLQIEYLF